MSAWGECQSCAWLRQRYNAPQPASPPARTAMVSAAHQSDDDDERPPAWNLLDSARQVSPSTWAPTWQQPIDLYAPSPRIRPRNRSPVQEWLLEEFRRASGEVDAGGTIERALAAGFTERQLRRARERLRVISYKRAWNEGWWWILPG
jgi:hypothetical protein